MISQVRKYYCIYYKAWSQCRPYTTSYRYWISNEKNLNMYVAIGRPLQILLAPVKFVLNQYFTMGYNQSCLIKTRQIWGIWKLRPAYSLETPNLGQNRWCFVPCDLQIWWMTMENNRASLLCCFKLCATFHSHWWIQTGVTVRKRPIWVKFDNF